MGAASLAVLSELNWHWGLFSVVLYFCFVWVLFFTSQLANTSRPRTHNCWQTALYNVSPRTNGKLRAGVNYCDWQGTICKICLPFLRFPLYQWGTWCKTRAIFRNIPFKHACSVGTHQMFCCVFYNLPNIFKLYSKKFYLSAEAKRHRQYENDWTRVQSKDWFSKTKSKASQG